MKTYKYNLKTYFQIEDLTMQQQVESYKLALRDWEDQQQRYRSALQARSAAAAASTAAQQSHQQQQQQSQQQPQTTA